MAYPGLDYSLLKEALPPDATSKSSSYAKHQRQDRIAGLVLVAGIAVVLWGLASILPGEEGLLDFAIIAAGAAGLYVWTRYDRRGSGAADLATVRLKRFAKANSLGYHSFATSTEIKLLKKHHYYQPIDVMSGRYRDMPFWFCSTIYIAPGEVASTDYTVVYIAGRAHDRKEAVIAAARPLKPKFLETGVLLAAEGKVDYDPAALEGLFDVIYRTIDVVPRHARN